MGISEKYILEISVKSGKQSASTLSLVIDRYTYTTFKGARGGGGLKLRKPSILMVPEFHPVFLFS
jgi:hypothetical protein